MKNLLFSLLNVTKFRRNLSYYVAFFGLSSIVLFSFGYISLFAKSLAELNVKFSFLNFPIFAGEILLFVCLLLFLCMHRCSADPKKFTKQHYLILFYCIFIVSKALYGYLNWGPLALRHAALFYYPVFGVLSYAFFRKDFLNRRKSLLLLVVISTMFITKGNSDYWTPSLILLGFIFIKSYPSKMINYIMFLAFLVIIPYRQLFHICRMMIVSNFLTGIYLIVTLPLILRTSKEIKLAFIMLTASVIILGVFVFTDYGAVKSIVSFRKMEEQFRSADAIIRAGMGQFQMKELKEVRIYNPDKVAEKDSEVGVALSRVPPVKRRELMRNTYESIEEKAANSTSVSAGTEVQEKGNGEQFNVPTVANINSEVQEKDNGEQFNAPTVANINNEVQEKDNGEQFNAPNVASINDEAEITFIDSVKQNAPSEFVKKQNASWADNGSAVFRLVIWRDLLRDLAKEKPVFGFDFGKPFRSKSLEILNWGTGDWARDGWIETHNSFLHIIYRTGVIGVLLIFSFLIMLFRMIRKFILAKSFTGVFLCGIIINWFVAANFLPVFELPYSAIPIWTIYGIALAYCYKTHRENSTDFKEPHTEADRKIRGVVVKCQELHFSYDQS